MKVYINKDLTAFEKVEHDIAVYQGSKNSASIFIYFHKYFGNASYPVISFQLPNGRKIGALLPDQLPESSGYNESGYAQCYQYKFGTSDLLVTGVATATITIVTTDGKEDPTILKKNVVGSFNFKMVQTASAGDYDITYSDGTPEEVTKSMVAEFDNIRSVLASYKDQVTVDSITESELNELLN